MARQVQLRRGTTAENNEFTGAVGELTMDTDTNGLRIHDGTTIGGVQVPTSGTADYVVEWQQPTDLNNYTWYRKYKSGWVEQGGFSDVGSATSRTITLPVTMANTAYTLITGLKRTTASGSGHSSVGGYIVSTTQITLIGDYNDGGGGSMQGAYWQVSGMGA